MHRRLAPAFVVVTSALNCGPSGSPPRPPTAATATALPGPALSSTSAPITNADTSAAPLSPTTLAAAPVPAPPRVVVIKSSNPPVVSMVQFDTLASKPLAASRSLIEEVARVLTAHPEVTRLLVEGHIDPRLEARQGKALARRRAEAVRTALIQRGIDGKRLVARGVAGACPFSDPPSEKNQRVMFHVLQKNGEAAATGCNPAEAQPDTARGAHQQ